MTAQSKTTIKSYFETGDKPTAAQFVDFIDSYQDAGNYVTTLTGDVTITTPVSGSSVATIASAAVTGSKIATKTVTATNLNSGVATSGQVPVADGAGGVAYGTVGSSLILLAIATAASSTTLDFLSIITSAYSHYIFDCVSLIPSGASPELSLRTSSNNSTFDSGASDYIYGERWVTGAGVAGQTGSISSALFIDNNVVSTSAAKGGFSGIVTLYEPTSVGSNKAISCQSVYSDDATAYVSQSGGYRQSTGAINAIRFQFGSGIASGKIYCYGVKNS